MSFEIEIVVAGAALMAGVIDLISNFSSRRKKGEKSPPGRIWVTLEKKSGEVSRVRLEANDAASIAAALSKFDETDIVRKIDVG